MGRANKVLLALLTGVGGARIARQKEGKSTKTWSPKLLEGQIDVDRPAFLFLDEKKSQVVISQFGLQNRADSWLPNIWPAASKISTISLDRLNSQVSAAGLSGKLGNDDVMTPTSANLKWPNKLSRVPEGYGDFIVVPDGFLPPGKSDGDMFLARPDGTVAKISKSKAGTFYHEVEWHDFDGDGLKDMLTARCTKTGIFSFKFTGELVWLKNPGLSKMDKVEWQETVITAGPDVIFKTVPYGNNLAVFTTQFFDASGPKISVQILNKQGVKIDGTIIDDNLGKPFAIDIVDLDGDGTKELLVTNHQGPDDPILPAVFAYEVEWNNLVKGTYKRHTLAWGPSENADNRAGVGAPGFAHGFYPKIGMSGPRYIFCAGDGSQDVWILKPSGGRFEYDTETIPIGGTTGQILDHDFDGDGVVDLLIPDNDMWKLKVMTFE